MGACGPSQQSSSTEYNSSNLPEFYYLNRSSCHLLTIRGNHIHKQKFSTHRLFHKDSGIGFNNSKNILMAGGSDPHNQLTFEFIQINPKLRSTEYLTSLPVPAKLGNLIHYNHWVYYVGGVTYNREGQESGIPLMRYNIKSKQWECLIFDIHELQFIRHFFPSANPGFHAIECNRGGHFR